jgi:adenine-specific DNA-methyltransferase
MIAAAFLNSLTFAFAEIIGRSYGGGVLELEPNEAEMLPIPLQGAERLDIQYLDTLLRKNDIESVLNITDRVLLAGGLGLGGQDIQLLRSIWKKLRNRRTNRKHR